MKTLLFILLLIATAEGQLFSGEGGCFNLNSTSEGVFNIYSPSNLLFDYEPTDIQHYPNYTRQPYLINFHIEYMEYSIGGSCNYGTGAKYIIKQGSYFIY